MALTADVPKVSRVAGVGIVKLAQHVGPADLSGGDRDQPPHRRSKNWDRSAINLPFGRGAMVGDGPIYVPRDADDATLEAARQAVEASAQRGRPRAPTRLSTGRERAASG